MSRVLKIHKHIPSALQASFAFPERRFSLVAEHPYERTAVRWLFVLLAVLLCGYVYFVTASILNVIARKEAVADIARTQNAISSLEQRYFTLSQAVTPERGVGLGLSQVSSVSYVYRPGNTAMAGGGAVAPAATIGSNEI